MRRLRRAGMFTVDDEMHFITTAEPGYGKTYLHEPERQDNDIEPGSAHIYLYAIAGSPVELQAHALCGLHHSEDEHMAAPGKGSCHGCHFPALTGAAFCMTCGAPVCAFCRLVVEGLPR